MHAGNLDNGSREKFLDCKTLFEYAFANYTPPIENLQEQNQENNLNTETEEVRNEEQLSNTSALRILSKVLAIIIIIVALKLLFFRKKKNRKRKFKARRK